MLFEERCSLLEQRRMVLAAFPTAQDGHIAPSKQRRRLRCAPWFPPGRPAKLLTVLPHDCGRRLQPNADTAALVNKGTLGGNAPDKYRASEPEGYCDLSLRRNGDHLPSPCANIKLTQMKSFIRLHATEQMIDIANHLRRLEMWRVHRQASRYP
jgi:hypothetical protein